MSQQSTQIVIRFIEAMGRNDGAAAEGDWVVVEFEGNATTREGTPYNNQHCMVVTLADGRIKQVNEYFCTLLADEVLWPLVEKMRQDIPSGGTPVRAEEPPCPR